jgi:hypothetical protein
VSGVVLRCPNCGTVQPVEGQCDACHEAAVRFFCTNHTPGLWLEGSACPQCGARFGDPAPSRPAPAPVAPSRGAPPQVGVPPTRGPFETEELEPWETGAPIRMEPGRPSPTGPDPFRILLGAMMSAARARSARAEYFDHEEPLRLRPRRGCCLGRLLVLALLLFALAILAPMIFGVVLGFN